jgi:hypothetical protein
MYIIVLPHDQTQFSIKNKKLAKRNQYTLHLLVSLGIKNVVKFLAFKIDLQCSDKSRMRGKEQVLQTIISIG